jgi:hypothetical protein
MMPRLAYAKHAGAGVLQRFLRNRFFHSLTGEGRDNIRLEEIVDSDEYFACLNPVFCSFLAIVALQTMAKKYQT